MKLISIILILLVIIGLILYFYLKNKDTFTTAQDAQDTVVYITYTVEVDGTNGYKFKDSSDNYLETNGINLNPTLTLEDGKTYEFNNTVNNGDHPFNLKDKDDTVVGIKDDSGTIILTATASETPYTYFCTRHSSNMTGEMTVITSSATTTTGAATTTTGAATTTTGAATTTTGAATTTTGAATTPPPAPTQPSTTQNSTLQPSTTQNISLTKKKYNEIINKQNVIITQLNSNIHKLTNYLNNMGDYNSNNDITEGFIDTITLNSDTFPEIKSYAEIYNKNVALLDDPNELKSKTFDAYIYMQNNKIKKMRDELKLLQETIQKNKTEIPAIKSFKSMNNSQSFNVELYNNKNPNNSNKYPNYLVYGNNGCLEYENNINDGAKWNFKSCDANNKNQQFVSTKIDNIDTYNSFINSETNKDRILKHNTSTLFGFNVINPIDAQDQCLQLNTDGLSVMPCSLDFSQRFRESYSTVMP